MSCSPLELGGASTTDPTLGYDRSSRVQAPSPSSATAPGPDLRRLARLGILAQDGPAYARLTVAQHQRVHIHQLPQTAPPLATLIEGLFGPAAATTPR
jgi:hypothetical protein